MHWNGTIGARLLTSSAAMAGLVLVLGITSLKISSDLGQELDNAVHKIARKQLLAGQINASASDMTAQERAVAFSTVLQQPDKAEGYKRAFRESQQRVEEALRDFHQLASADSASAEIEGLTADYESLKRNHQEFVDMLGRQQMDVALKAFDDTLLPSLNRMSQAARRLVDSHGQELVSVAQSAESKKAVSRWITIGLLALGALASAAIIISIRRSTAMLRGVTSQMADCAEQVSSASHQISSASQTLAQGASQQAGSLEQTSSSSQEMSSMTQRNAENSRKVTELMVDTDRRIAEANRTLEQMVASMRDINAASEKVANIIRVIDEISFQTNILALNAAVEAARAGEAGMGFAVVADEVRNLAQRCAQAARDTTTLIEESIASSNEGSQKLARMTEAIRSITQSATEVKRLVEEVNQGSHEQAHGIEQIAAALTAMQQVTQAAAASAEESASASDMMQQQASTLDTVVHQLVDMVGSDERRARARA